MAQINLPEGSAASTPSTGNVAIYAKTDGKVYAKDDAGTEYDLASRVIQVVEGTPYITYSSTATTIPNDDTIPQNTEGAEWNTVSITPTSTSNRLVVEAEFSAISASGAIACTAALFQDSTANALAATQSTIGSAGYLNALRIRHEMAAGTTSATTFKVRAGPASGTMYVNGSNSARTLGGINAVRIRVTEIKV